MTEPSIQAKPELLLVDDDRNFCDALGRALVRRGISVINAYAADDALAQAEARHPAYGVVDMRLAEASGLELIPALRERAPGIVVIILTGYASVATAVEAIKRGASDYLTKPIRPEQILETLSRESESAGNSETAPPSRPMSLPRLEWEHLQAVLQRHDGNVSAAARALGMHRRTLQRKLRKRPVRE